MSKRLDERTKKFIDSVYSDLRALSNETKRKFHPVKEAAEAGIQRLKTLSLSARNRSITTVLAEENEILQPFLLGCDTKSLRVIQISLTALQRLITNQALSESSANNLVGTLWHLMNGGLEELRILQTVILLITTSNIIHGDHLGKAMALCFRLYFVKDSTVSATAAATVRQMVSVVFDRVVTEDSNPKEEEMPEESSSSRHRNCPVSLRPCARDAYLLFQDLCQLTSGEQPYWLHGVVEMTRTFGLELLESILKGYPHIFLKVTECEIFLSLLVKFLESDKPLWQRALALEVIHTLTVQPALLQSFCQFYDMQEHSTKIFHNIINALSSFIQSLFTSQTSHGTGPSSGSGPMGATIQTSSSAPTPSVLALSAMGGVTPQPGFLYQGAWIPLTVMPVSGQAKSIYLDHLEKQDTPTIPDGYTLSIAFACVLEIVKGLNTLVVQGESTSQADQGWIEPDEHVMKSSDTGVGAISINAMAKDKSTDQDNSSGHVGKQMVNASWCGVLASLSILLEASNDETAIEAILKSYQICANVCGILHLNTPRDAFITSLCKASLPPHYTLTVVNPHSGKAQVSYVKHPSSSHGAVSDSLCGGGNDQAVLFRGLGGGTVLSGTPLGGSHGPVSLTAKNVQCMRSILSLAHCHGGILGTAWHMVLITLQHLTWILGLKPSTGGTLKAMPTSEAPNLVISQTLMAELPVLSAILSRLFETSQRGAVMVRSGTQGRYLDDVGLHHLVDALCQLSTTSMEQAQSNKEPSLFAVAKLLETGINNLHRARVLWKPLTAHLLEVRFVISEPYILSNGMVCQHTHSKMREWGAEAVTSLVRSALMYDHKPPLTENTSLQAMLLSPLQEMSSISYSDIRYKQLECVLQILHSTGQNLGHGWPCVLGVIGAATNQQGEGLIRVAFQSLQLVVTDFLPLMPCAYLKVVIDVAGKFGLQPLELNISLTAIGLLWNIADFLSQNQDKIREGLEGSTSFEGFKYDRPVPPSDRLWMCLYSKLGELCVDPRPAVRKSAGQTLFSTISVHESLLQRVTWYTVLWQVLFPLLDQVKRMSTTAASIPPPSDINQSKNKILIHHSRDTAEKQWAETRVLTMNGVARVFNTRRQTLAALDEFPRAWALLLEFIESAALSKSSEVALAALKSFQEMVHDSSENNDADKEEMDIQMLLDPARAAKARDKLKVKPKFYEEAEDLNLWMNAWKVWCDVGMASLCNSSFTQTRVDPEGKTVTTKIYPTQPYITALVQIVPNLFRRIYNRFGLADLHKLSKILQACVRMPVPADQSPFLVPSFQDTVLTPLQHAILDVVDILREPLPNSKGSVLDIASQPMYPTLFVLLVDFMNCACIPPIADDAVSVGKKKEWVILELTPFSEKCLDVVVELYRVSVNKTAVIEEKVMEKIIKALRTPMGLKYDCSSQTTWKLAVNSLLTILRIGLPVALNNPASFSSMWYELASCLEDFLFSEKTPPDTQSLEQHQQDEELDIKLLRMIQEDILPHSSTLPKDFMVRVMALLNRGSIHSATDSTFSGTDASNFPIREEFAKSCFETLLQFSFVSGSSKQDATDGKVSELALDSMLSRCQDVLEKYVEDERLSGKCPLPRTRMAEMSFVMKAISTLIASLKKLTRENPRVVDQNIWDQVVQLYPRLVECTTCNSNQVRRALKEALQEYKDLLVTPRVDTKTSSIMAINGS
ncbi:hypothetical protein QZH41_015645 [Actinostola sp. cb2023]|nr:hypothetical protein QZH41_015645 [Actinostola sp. cb2023]